MVAPVPAHISKLRPRVPAAALPPTTHYPPLTAHSLFSCLQTLNSFASYRIPATPAVSCDYALFCATALADPSYFQWLPHSFYRHGGVPLHHSRRQSFRLPARQRFCLQEFGASLSSLCTLSCTRFLYFQWLAASFPKTPGVGVSRMQLFRLRTRRRR